MNVKLEKLSQCKVKLTITCDKESMNHALDHALEEACKTVEVKGFRKGHCPKNIYLQRFGEASLYNDAIDHVLNETYYKAVTENNVMVVAAPKIDIDFETLGRDKEFVYTAEVEIYPDITLGEYKGVEVEQDKVNVTDEDVNKYISQVLKNKAELVLVEDRALQNGDTAIFDFEGFVDGVAFEGGKSENYTLKIGSGQFIPGFEEGMVGMTSGSERDVNVTFPENYQAAELAGKAAVFKVKLHEIKEEVLPELTDEFVQELELKDIETVDQYKVDVLNKLTTEALEASNNKLVDDLLTKVCDDAIADIPEALVDEEVNNYISRVEEQAKMYGMTAEMLLSFQGMDMETFKGQVRESAKKRVLEEVVLHKISKVENIVPSEEAIEEEYKKFAEGYNQDVETVKKQIAKENIVAFLSNKLVLDFLKDNAIIK